MTDSMTREHLLDLGSGPCIHTIISASRGYSELHLSDYASQNRQALEDWVDKKSNAIDWTPFLQKVASLENKR